MRVRRREGGLRREIHKGRHQLGTTEIANCFTLRRSARRDDEKDSAGSASLREIPDTLHSGVSSACATFC
jgi:hypothetical protein